MFLSSDAKKALKATSRTFYIPISRLPAGLQEAIASAYLCMRAIDEIEDHPDLPSAVKVELLNNVSRVLQSQTFVESFSDEAFDTVFRPYKGRVARSDAWFGKVGESSTRRNCPARMGRNRRDGKPNGVLVDEQLAYHDRR